MKLDLLQSPSVRLCGALRRTGHARRLNAGLWPMTAEQKPPRKANCTGDSTSDERLPANEAVYPLCLGEFGMKQPHTESTIQHTDDQQNTGNHKKPGSPDAHGADKFGGTRAGAENIEKPHRDEARKRATD